MFYNKQTLILLLFLLLGINNVIAQENYVQYVDPFIGTGGHGHTFPGVATPFGMVQLSPDTRVDGSWDGCSGYHQSDSKIYGFSHTHLSGTGCSDYGDFMLMPMMGETSFDNKIYSSSFSHQNEKASAGYYSVKLDDDNIDVELTASTRVGFHKYKFNKDGVVSFILDLNHRDKLLAGVIKIVNERTVETFRCSEAWAKSQKAYAHIAFSRGWNEIKNPPVDEKNPPKNPWDKTIKSAFVFRVKKGDSIMVKVAISPISIKGAEKNMIKEIPDWDFEKVKKQAEDAWNKELGKIEVQDNSAEKKKIFYTAMYHCMIHPSLAMDVDSMYRGMDDLPHKADGYAHYNVFSLWDTFRALHPLLSIIDKKITVDFIRSFLSMYEQGGRLPVWELSANETDCMIGYHSVSVIADAMTKGIRGFDYNKAYAAAKHSAELDRDGLKAYKRNGFIAIDDEGENVSKTLEYAYDDWCIAQMAKVVGDQKGYDAYMERANHWIHVMDKNGFAHPRQNGGWLTPFDPKRVDNNFTEANAWQYTFFVPHDIQGMITVNGGGPRLEEKLDSLFTTSSQTTGREQADITGLIGQYAHGNEPSHHIAYLYNYTLHPYKTQVKVQNILKNFYKADPDGLIGNEDCGQMSAWYVLSSLGLYQVCPGKPQYEISAPIFEQAKIHLESGKEFTIENYNLSPYINYTDSLVLDKVKYQSVHVPYTMFEKNKELRVYLSEYPNTNNHMEADEVQAGPARHRVPFVESNQRTFRDSMQVKLSSFCNTGCELHYTIDGSRPTKNSPLYFAPFYVSQTTNLKVIEYGAEDSTFVVNATFHKIPNDWEVFIYSKYNSQYTAGGDAGIIDGLRGDANWRKGDWQGYQGQDFEAVIDLGSTKYLTEFGAGFLQDTRAWILFPKKVSFEVSLDGKTFTPATVIENTIADTALTVQTKDFSKTILKQKARFVKVRAENYGTLPAWHAGAGGEAFIFVDEILLRE